jgi:hypothetical protein
MKNNYQKEFVNLNKYTYIFNKSKNIYYKIIIIYYMNVINLMLKKKFGRNN